MDVIELLTAKPVCIYVLYNWEDKKVYVGYSTKSLISSVNNTMNLIGNKIKGDTKKVRFEMIYEYDSRNIYWIKYIVDRTYKWYIADGYTLYTPYKPLEWVVRVRVGNVRGDSRKMQQKAIVELVQSNHTRVTLKTFDTVEEANIYASNGLERLLLLY